MSDARETDDPVLQTLVERAAELAQAISNYQARLDEVNVLMQSLQDGRSRLSRRRRTNSTGTQPAFPEPGPAMEAAQP